MCRPLLLRCRRNGVCGRAAMQSGCCHFRRAQVLLMLATQLVVGSSDHSLKKAFSRCIRFASVEARSDKGTPCRMTATVPMLLEDTRRRLGAKAKKQVQSSTTLLIISHTAKNNSATPTRPKPPDVEEACSSVRVCSKTDGEEENSLSSTRCCGGDCSRQKDCCCVSFAGELAFLVGTLCSHGLDRLGWVKMRANLIVLVDEG